MLQLMHGASVGTGYYGDPEDVTLYETINITCSSCDRLIYRKEMEKTVSAYSQYSPE